MPPKDGLQTKPEEEQAEEREVFLRDGRRVVVTEGREPLVEIRSESGMVELRVRLTEEGPVLQMEAARLTLKATESVAIESPKVEIKATEQLEMTGGDVKLHAENEMDVDANGDIRVVGKTINLN